LFYYFYFWHASPMDRHSTDCSSPSSKIQRRAMVIANPDMYMVSTTRKETYSWSSTRYHSACSHTPHLGRHRENSLRTLGYCYCIRRTQ
jgi:hypothetical protein